MSNTKKSNPTRGQQRASQSRSGAVKPNTAGVSPRRRGPRKDASNDPASSASNANTRPIRIPKPSTLPFHQRISKGDPIDRIDEYRAEWVNDTDAFRKRTYSTIAEVYRFADQLRADPELMEKFIKKVNESRRGYKAKRGKILREAMKYFYDARGAESESYGNALMYERGLREAFEKGIPADEIPAYIAAAGGIAALDPAAQKRAAKEREKAAAAAERSHEEEEDEEVPDEDDDEEVPDEDDDDDGGGKPPEAPQGRTDVANPDTAQEPASGPKSKAAQRPKFNVNKHLLIDADDFEMERVIKASVGTRVELNVEVVDKIDGWVKLQLMSIRMIFEQ